MQSIIRTLQRHLKPPRLQRNYGIGSAFSPLNNINSPTRIIPSTLTLIKHDTSNIPNGSSNILYRGLSTGTGNARSGIPNFTKIETTYNATENAIQLTFHTQDTIKTTQYHSIWLRDHCKCAKCFHPVTKQRLFDTSSMDLVNTRPKNFDIENGVLKINWVDGHESFFRIEWLWRNSYFPKLEERKPVKRVLWGKEIADDIPVVDFRDVMNSEDGLRDWLDKIDTYGICFIDNTPPTTTDTEALGNRLSYIRETHYGKFWDFTANMEHGDTAYTNIALPAHTDTTYFTDPIGLQLFHLIEFKGRGGESLYVDGFHVADQLSARDFETLSTVRVDAHCAGDDDVFVTPFGGKKRFPILGVMDDYDIIKSGKRSDGLFQIRYNNDDRNILSTSFKSREELERFYQALQNYSNLLKQPRNEFWIANKPGRAVIVDNWRVLHGRASYSGHRRLCGCYFGWDEYRSRVDVVVNKNERRRWL